MIPKWQGREVWAFVPLETQAILLFKKKNKDLFQTSCQEQGMASQYTNSQGVTSWERLKQLAPLI